MKWKQRIWTPLAVRFPLLDPDRFLTRTLPYVRFIFTKYGAWIWALTVGIATVLAAANWSALTENIVDRALAPANLFLLWLVYPFVKTIHELCHGYATKVSGGEVHEIGIMLLVLVPVPYVDASSAWGFRDKGVFGTSAAECWSVRSASWPSSSWARLRCSSGYWSNRVSCTPWPTT
jgi:putative peptide zinc metalloprotease protein